MQIAQIGEMRLEKVLLKDKKDNPKIILEMLKSDLKSLFQNYMEIDGINLGFDIDDKVYKLNITATATRIKSFGVIKA